MNYILNLIRNLLGTHTVDTLINDFATLEAKLAKIASTHFTKVGLLEEEHKALEAAKAEIRSEIADTKLEIERARKIADNVAQIFRV